MLFDDALFEDGLAGVGLFVADLDPLLSHLCDKVFGFGFLGEFVGVLAGSVLLTKYVYSRVARKREVWAIAATLPLLMRPSTEGQPCALSSRRRFCHLRR